MPGLARRESLLQQDDTRAAPRATRGSVQAQRAYDLLIKIDRYEGDEVVGWLVEDVALDADIW